MDEHPALALREKKDATILVATDLVRRGEADAVMTAGHTGAGMAAAILRLGPPARRRPPGPRGPDDHRRRARWSCSTSAPTPTRPPRTSPSTRRWARSSPSGCWASPTRASRCCRSARRRARATPGSRRATELLDASGLQFRGQRRGQGPHDAPGRRRRLRRGPRQRRHQVLRGPVGLHLRPVAGRVPAARCAGRLAYAADAARASAGSGRCSTTRRSADRRCSA